MATPKSQRIGIWIIAIVMLVGTIGSFAVMILASKNSITDQAYIQKLSAQYQKDYAAYQAKLATQTTQLSSQYYPTFNAYAGLPASFDKSSVTSLTTQDLKVGTGATLGANPTFTAYYIGWTPDGNVFDSSIASGQLKAPITAAPGGVITGWTSGVVGMKMGGVRVLSIPAAQAYGSAGSGAKIPANTPLKFVIMLVPTPSTIAQPVVPQDLINYYNANNTSSPSTGTSGTGTATGQ
jgi:FKBP-type peptidyl-prolyl cis-trans isomerase